ncbi:MAG: LppX_LprAFG lipoprotein, partial [Ornithinimicrobium sp.]
MSYRATGHRWSRRVAVGFLAAVLCGVTACSDDAEPEAVGEETSAPTAQDRLDEAYDVLAEAGSVSLVLEGRDLPEEENAYVIKADGSGTTNPAAFDGTITAKIAGVQADVPTVALDGELFVKLPFSPVFTSVSPESLGVPDPARLFDSEVGVVSLLSQTDSAEFGDQTRVGSDVVQEITGTLSGDLIVDLLNVGAEDTDFDVVYGLIEDDWQVRTVTLTGQFYRPATSTYTLTLDDYGVPVTVTAP